MENKELPELEPEEVARGWWEDGREHMRKEVLDLIDNNGQEPSIVGDNNVKEFLDWRDKLKEKIKGK